MTNRLAILVCILIFSVACAEPAAISPEPTSEPPRPEPASPSPEPPTPEPPTPTALPPTPTPEPPTPTPVPDLLGLVQAYQEAHNGRDIEASAGFFAPDARLSLGAMVLEGKDQIRAFHEYQLMLNAELQLNACAVDEKTVTCQALLSNDFDRAMGIYQLNFPAMVYRFEGDQIQEVNGAVHPARAPVVDHLRSNFREWTAENRPDKYAQLYNREDQTIYSPANAERVIPLIEEWRETTEQALQEALVGIWAVEGDGLYLIFNSDGTGLETTSLEEPMKTDPFHKIGWIQRNWSLQGPMLNLTDVTSEVQERCPGSQVGRWAVEVVQGVSLSVTEIVEPCEVRAWMSSRDWIWQSP
jgi:hypothetical protein